MEPINPAKVSISPLPDPPPKEQKPIPTPKPVDGPAIEIHKDGTFTVNGKLYEVANLRIKGRKIDTSKLNEDGQKAIETLARLVFKQAPKDTPVKSAAFTGTSHTLKVTYNKTKTVQEIKIGEFAPSLISQMHALRELDADVPPKLVTKGAMDTHKTIIQDYKTLTGGNYGTQVIERQSVIQETYLFADNMIYDCEQRLNKSLSQEEKTRVEKEKVFYENQKKQADKYLAAKDPPRDWLDSNYFRSHIKEKGFAAAAKELIAAPINMRVQKLLDPTNDDEVTKIVRLGVISDMRNGRFSLKDLKEITPEEKQEALTKLNREREEKKGKLANTTDRKKRDTLEDTIQSLDRAIHDLEHLEDAILERRLFLRQQMVQLIMTQLREHPEMILEQAFHMAQLSLLDQYLDTEEVGWKHNERVEMEDMNEIFQEFDGAQIIFVDRIENQKDVPSLVERVEDGKVVFHLTLPKPKDLELERDTVTLHTYFFNLTVQSSKHGSTPNKGTQREINQANLRKLQEKFGGETLNFVSTDAYSSYDSATACATQLTKLPNLAVGINCLSAKDRTGIIAERVMQERAGLTSLLVNPFAHWGWGGLGAFPNFGPAGKALEDNTDTRRLKVKPPLFTSVDNLFHRVGQCFQRTFSKGAATPPSVNESESNRAPSLLQD